MSFASSFGQLDDDMLNVVPSDILDEVPLPHGLPPSESLKFSDEVVAFPHAALVDTDTMSGEPREMFRSWQSDIENLQAKHLREVRYMFKEHMDALKGHFESHERNSEHTALKGHFESHERNSEHTDFFKDHFEPQERNTVASYARNRGRSAYTRNGTASSIERNTVASRGARAFKTTRDSKVLPEGDDTADMSKNVDKIRTQLRTPRSRMKFVFGSTFALFSALLIVGNFVYIAAFQHNKMLNLFYARENGLEYEDALGWIVVEVSFTALFAIELVLRVLAGAHYFVLGPERLWNYFDAFVVSAAIFETILRFSKVDGLLDVSLLRSLRLIRVIRIFRIAKTVAMIRNLRTILQSLGHAVQAFVPAMLLLSIVIGVFGLTLMQGLIINLETSAELTDAAASLKKYFGSLHVCLWTMLGVVSGGIDWFQLVEPIGMLGLLYTLSILLYIVIVTFGLINLLAGIFVNAAFTAAKLNRDIAIDEQLAATETMNRELITLMIECDADHDEILTWEEVQHQFTDERLRAYFTTLDLDMKSVGKVFQLIEEQNGIVKLEDFVTGCLYYRGSAKAVDLHILRSDSARLMQKVEDIEALLRASGYE